MSQEWEGAAPLMSDDALMLAEQSHRLFNEVAAVLASLHLAKVGRGRSVGEMLDVAIARLEAFAESAKSMMVPPSATYDLGAGLHAMCTAMVTARPSIEGSVLTLDVVPVPVPGDTARRVMMVASELVTNALRYALDGRQGALTVVLRRTDREIRLGVADDGPGVRVGSVGSGMGRPIIHQIVHRCGGTMSCEASPAGTIVRVIFPITGHRRRVTNLKG